VKSVDADGIIWVKEVEDYQRFGVVVTDKDGNMTKIIEKPKMPISKRANIGLYYIRNWKLLFEGIDYVLTQPKNLGEYFLTDAFQYMIDKGAKIKVIDVEGWYDAGKIETMIETNQAMLERGRSRRPKSVGDSTIIDPVYIEDNVTLRKSKVGPNVSIGAGSVLDSVEISHSIVGAKANLKKSVLRNSLIGNDTIVEGVDGEVTLGDNSEVHAS
jgi:glucose-1-phosphate thymidylyltransferase